MGLFGNKSKKKKAKLTIKRQNSKNDMQKKKRAQSKINQSSKTDKRIKPKKPAVGNIFKTNDNILDSNHFSKNDRRVVVTDNDGLNIKLNKFTKDKDYVVKATDEQRKKQKRFSTKVKDHTKYPKSLTLPSVIDKKQYSVNQSSKQKFTMDDKNLKPTGEKLLPSDMKKVRKVIKKKSPK